MDKRTNVKLNSRMQAIVEHMLEAMPVITDGSPTKAVEHALIEWHMSNAQEEKQTGTKPRVDE